MSVISFIKKMFTKRDKLNALSAKQTEPKVTDQMIEFPPGTKIISVSNEDEPYQIGHIVRYEPITLAKQMTPIVRFEGSDEEFLSLSHFELYSEALCNLLEQFNNIEQWNILVHDHCQIKEKNGVKVKTFECKCEECKALRNGGKLEELRYGNCKVNPVF